jgi:hypothetical protein
MNGDPILDALDRALIDAFKRGDEDAAGELRWRRRLRVRAMRAAAWRRRRARR